MNWSDSTLHDHDASPDPVPDSKAAVPANGPLFLGDSGELGYDARRAACQLLAGPSVDAQRQPAQWAALLRNEAAIRSLLCDLFLELVMDRDAGFAFVRQADTGELEAPSLLRTAPLTFIESVLLLFLRQQLADADTRGERAVVEELQMVEAMSVYQKNVSTDQAGFAKRVAAAIGKMRENQLLSRLRGSEDRYEVSPALKHLFSAEDVAVLGETYRQLREGGTPVDDLLGE
ncbi:DUF4194 domain-containing protein [Stenotrophomonas sp. W1S232]|jgi:hypothetical protein|uniref:DUF4194 domain-containing protein n=1 Tax=Stenotrophomonas koreensis TaxID=266128 RepID=A0A0R0BTL2_9GAMM|nr:DUF4194 domain-containing protein [Stenotrophomonas koreensis]KRG60441.1 hypothetical protein ABB25_01260 [Stenotrophomonas koreensis]MBB1116132.1 DUF4194 domain-containing protein [Stenotrophomonas koreensis]